MGFVRAYHFVPTKHGLDDIQNRRLKIARIEELNDPFEMWAVAQEDPTLRKAFRKTKNELAQKFGVVCLSLSWDNPLLWSHYADRHRGLVLGFDVDTNLLKKISYVRNRPSMERINQELAVKLLFTKYIDWKYEKEARIYVRLERADPKSRHYFADFNEQLSLREVIAGPLNETPEQELRVAVHLDGNVMLRKARLAFKTFKVVEDKRGFGTS